MRILLEKKGRFLLPNRHFFLPLRAEMFLRPSKMKKFILDLTVRKMSVPHEGYALMQLTDPNGPLPEMVPGQFVEVRADNAPNTFLRRPISINLVDRKANELWLLVHAVGDGTRAMAALQEGDTVNVVLPLGNGFTMPEAGGTLPEAGGTLPEAGGRYLLVGGGVGTAPLLYMGQELAQRGYRPTFLLGARTGDDVLQLELFRELGDVYVTTEDGSMGERGFVTQHSIWDNAHYDRICTCGPKPMMVAVARLARDKGIDCEASLENMMACGLGACLCCVEDTTAGNVCVCKEGPVFNTKELKW